MGWESVEICRVCWVKLKGPIEPHRVIADSRIAADACELCMRGAVDGIYVRLYLAPKPEGKEE